MGSVSVVEDLTEVEFEGEVASDLVAVVLAGQVVGPELLECVGGGDGAELGCWGV